MNLQLKSITDILEDTIETYPLLNEQELIDKSNQKIIGCVSRIIAMETKLKQPYLLIQYFSLDDDQAFKVACQNINQQDINHIIAMMDFITTRNTLSKYKDSIYNNVLNGNLRTLVSIYRKLSKQ